MDLAQASSYRTDKVTYSAIHIISVMRQSMTKVNFIYRNCIQLRWILRSYWLTSSLIAGIQEAIQFQIAPIKQRIASLG